MPITDNSMYRQKSDIVVTMLSALTAAISDAYVGEDGVMRIIFEIEASQLENVFLANQLLLEDSFVTTAAFSALQRYGDQYGLPMQQGTYATGVLKFTGGGGTYVAIGSEVAYDPGSGLDPIFFDTTTDGTIPDPGIPAAPTTAINATGGNLNGLYEYAVTFVTASGETLPSAISNASSPVNQQVNLTAIPVGGTGTTARNIYRDKNGTGIYRFVAQIANNTATTYTDNILDATVAAASQAPTVDTAHSITVNAQAQLSGVEGNAAAGVINEITNAPSTLTDVINPNVFSGGSEPEDTEAYRGRILAAIQDPQTGSPSDIAAWAENVDGVGSATVFPNTPGAGQVTTRITGEGGSVPSSTLISTVQSTLVGYDLANIVHVVAGFNPVTTNITVDVTTSGTYALADVTPQVQQALTDYINSLDVGGTLLVSGIIDAVFGLAGIADVVVTSPTTNQTTAATDKRVPGTISVT